MTGVNTAMREADNVTRIPVPRRPVRVFTVSDLHLFCRRSRASHHMESIHAACRQADAFVLNGDIVDYRWSVHRHPEDTTERALIWLDRLASAFPACHFHYVLGNHDNAQSMIRALPAFTRARHNISWYPFYVRLGSSVFLHGDVVMRYMGSDQLARYRRRWLHDSRRGEIMNRIYDAAATSGVTKTLHQVAFTKRGMADRILFYLDAVGDGPSTGVRRVFYGHTHVHMDFVCRGVRFTNGGAPMPGLEFQVLEADMTRQTIGG